MNMIWIFGDSFSEPFSKIIYQSYITHKGYTPKQYYNHFGEELNMDYINTAKGGNSNEFIFYEFINQYKNIMNGDYVIFGWSEMTRFEYVDTKENRWRSSTQMSTKDSLSENTINEIKINRDHSLYVKQFCDRIPFINDILKGKKVIHWSWVNHEPHYSIETETNGIIKDGHYGEYGHRELYKILSQGIKDKDTFTYNIPICNRTMI